LRSEAGARTWLYIRAIDANAAAFLGSVTMLDERREPSSVLTRLTMLVLRGL
jgi:hypothetical protein